MQMRVYIPSESSPVLLPAVYPWLVTGCLAVFFRYPPLLFGIMATERPTRTEIRRMVTVFFIMLARKLCPMKQLCSGVLLFQWDFVCRQHTYSLTRKILSHSVAQNEIKPMYGIKHYSRYTVLTIFNYYIIMYILLDAVD